MTTAPSTFWQPAYRGGRVEELEMTECRQLLAATSVGRLGYTANLGQRIVPMNYVIFDDHLVFRTLPDHDVAHYARGTAVAFEIDQIDEFLQTGWSVLVTGISENFPAASLRAMDVGEAPQPWAAGVRSLYLCLPLTNVTGRRVHPA